jgi:hypothetical protein
MSVQLRFLVGDWIFSITGGKDVIILTATRQPVLLTQHKTPLGVAHQWSKNSQERIMEATIKAPGLKPLQITLPL